MEEVADFTALRRAALERVPIREASRVPEFTLASGVYEVWSRLSCDGLPAHPDLDPLRFGPKPLPNMALIDVLNTGADYRWRLCGERVAMMLGTRLKGKRLSELEAQLGDGMAFRGLLDQVVRYRAPRFYVMRHTTLVGTPKRTYGVLLPLCRAPGPAEAPAPVATILSASDWCNGH